MIYTSTVTQKGQVTIPVEIRNFLGIKPYEKIAFKKENGKIVINRPADFWALRGSLKSDKKYNDDEADKIIGEHIAKEYEKKLRRNRR